jgi:hypothetical protein
MVVTIVAGTDPTEHIARMAMYRPHMCGWMQFCSVDTYEYPTAGLRDIHELKESTVHDHTYSNVDTGF